MESFFEGYLTCALWSSTDNRDMSFKTISDVRRANKAAGHHFFDRDTMRFFSSRVVSSLYAGRFFVTAETGPGQAWPRFSVREALASGVIETRGEFQAHRFIEDAREAARNLAREVRK